MKPREKYRELVDLLEHLGVLQLDTEWSEQIKAMVKAHEGRVSMCDCNQGRLPCTCRGVI